ncbi:MAG: TerC family protein [Spirochaetia bacterium]|nr:TerC family protein [Spirochaetia bacterium]
MEQYIQILTNPEAWIALVTLSALEIVLGIDNIIFITILVGRVEKSKQAMARNVGLVLAMLMRILLLLSISFIMTFTMPLFSFLSKEISGRDMVLLLGGLFLIWKSTFEIHTSLEGHEKKESSGAKLALWSVLMQIIVLDLVFSIDSVITAVGMAKDIPVMAAAIIIAVIVMMVAAKSIGEFVEEHPTVKMLALSFLILVGVALIAESLAFHIPRGYIYFSLAFSVLVELLNIRLRKKAKAVQLYKQLGE